MKEHSKRYEESVKQVDKGKTYQLKEAIGCLKKMAPVKFDSSVDLHFHLLVDTKKSDQMVRGTVILPHGTGKRSGLQCFAKGNTRESPAGQMWIMSEDSSLLRKLQEVFLILIVLFQLRR